MKLLREWLPAFAGMTCLGLGAGLISIYGFFVEDLATEFDAGLAAINAGPVALLLVPGLIGPLVGRLVDSVPVRRLMLIGATIAMVSLALASQAPTLWLAGLAFLGFALGVSLYGPVVVNAMLVRRFPHREARALAIAAMGISFASMILPPLVGVLLSIVDWRTTLLGLSLALLVLIWLVIISSIDANDGAVATAETTASDTGFYRRAPFWLIGFCLALAFNVTIILSVAYAPYFLDEGFSVTQAGWFLSIAGAGGFTGKLLIAWLADSLKAFAKWIAVGLLLVQAAGLLLLLSFDQSAGVLAALFLLGFGGGGMIPIHPYLNSRYFEASVIGQVNGAQMPLFLPFGLIGAPLAGYTYDQMGSYEPVMQALIIVLCLAAMLVVILPGVSAQADTDQTSVGL
ncbi:MAG: MFS transporter [Halieaceae bacterium]